MSRKCEPTRNRGRVLSGSILLQVTTLHFDDEGLPVSVIKVNSYVSDIIIIINNYHNNILFFTRDLRNKSRTDKGKDMKTKNDCPPLFFVNFLFKSTEILSQTN